MADVFNADPAPEELDLNLNDLVGEGKKYSDPDQLAKAYANIEAHARKLEKENAEARAKADALEAANSRNTPPEGEQEPPVIPDQNAPAPKAPTPGSNDQEFRSQIRKEVEALDEQRRSVKNVELAAQKMVEHYGDVAKANEAVKQRAQELGVSVEWLQDSASKSPSAFYATMGLTGNHSTSTPAPNSEVNFNRSGNEPIRGFEHYEKLRKSDPKLYWKPDTQREMLSQAKRLGDEFYKR